jgi:hypothetical protein
MTLEHRPSELIKTLRKRFVDYKHCGVEIHAKGVEALLDNLKVIETVSLEIEALAEQAATEQQALALQAASTGRDRKVIIFPVRQRPTGAPDASPPDGGNAA